MLNSLRSIHWHGIQQPLRLPNRIDLASKSRAKLKISKENSILLILKCFHAMKTKMSATMTLQTEYCKNIRHEQSGAGSDLELHETNENASQRQLTGITQARFCIREFCQA